jgi:hypothetical protein
MYDLDQNTEACKTGYVHLFICNHTTQYDYIHSIDINTLL